jgi:EAL domain-containing protein (putative c-di-GMP-specific phosphodiesterase class I)
MYDAKRAGSGVQVYDTQTDPREAQQLTMLGELRKGIVENQLRLHYQPKCRADGAIEEVEALVRWQHPERGLLPPGAFVPLAERTALVRPLTTWVLNEAARQCAEWWKAGRKLSVAVNVCPRNLVNDDLAAIVRAAAAPYNLPLRALRLEITETAVIADEERAIAVLQQLRELGVEVSIDDFGAGYTSLSYLPTLPVKALKIDKQFIDNMVRDELDEAVVRNVIHLAHDLGMTTVAEGVETFEVWDRLIDLGCDEIQGYILTKPLPPDALLEWLDHWRDTPAAPRKPAVAHSAP